MEECKGGGGAVTLDLNRGKYFPPKPQEIFCEGNLKSKIAPVLYL